MTRGTWTEVQTERGRERRTVMGTAIRRITFSAIVSIRFCLRYVRKHTDVCARIVVTTISGCTHRLRYLCYKYNSTKSAYYTRVKCNEWTRNGKLQRLSCYRVSLVVGFSTVLKTPRNDLTTWPRPEPKRPKGFKCAFRSVQDYKKTDRSHKSLLMISRREIHSCFELYFYKVSRFPNTIAQCLGIRKHPKFFSDSMKSFSKFRYENRTTWNDKCLNFYLLEYGQFNDGKTNRTTNVFFTFIVYTVRSMSNGLAKIGIYYY